MTAFIAGPFDIPLKKEGRREASAPRGGVGAVAAVVDSSPSLDVESRFSMSFPSLVGGDVVIRRSDV